MYRQLLTQNRRVIGPKRGLSLQSAITTTSGTAHEFTNIPEAKRITAMLSQVSLSGTDELEIELGISSGYETSGYVGSVIRPTVAAVAWSSGAQITSTSVAAEAFSGKIDLVLADETTNLWAITGLLSIGTATDPQNCAGVKPLAGVLTQLRLKSTGANTFDNGIFNILIET